MTENKRDDAQIPKWRGAGKPSFSSSKDEPLATAGTGGSADPKKPGLKPKPSNPASVTDTDEREEALREGPGPAEGRTDNKAGG
jgi:hypothetical protein